MRCLTKTRLDMRCLCADTVSRMHYTMLWAWRNSSYYMLWILKVKRDGDFKKCPYHYCQYSTAVYSWPNHISMWTVHSPMYSSNDSWDFTGHPAVVACGSHMELHHLFDFLLHQFLCNGCNYIPKCHFCPVLRCTSEHHKYRGSVGVAWITVLPPQPVVSGTN